MPALVKTHVHREDCYCSVERGADVTYDCIHCQGAGALMVGPDTPVRVLYCARCLLVLHLTRDLLAGANG